MNTQPAPTEQKCPACAGLGYIMAFIGPEETCEDCGGTGKITMNTTKLKLTNPTDDELSAAVAEHVAGWVKVRRVIGFDGPETDYYDGHPPTGGPRYLVTSYTTSADAVLPLLERGRAEGRRINIEMGFKWWRVWISDKNSEGLYDGRCDGEAETLPRAACIALLRANGIEVEVTP